MQIITKSILCLMSFMLFVANIALADFTWLPTESTYDGTPFMAIPGGLAPAGTGTTGISSPAYGAGFNAGFAGGYGFGFISQIPIGDLTPQISDLSSTPLVAGTDLVLVFQKADSDDVSFIGMMADNALDIGYKELSATKIQITASVVNPVQSASGDLGAAFGLIIVTTAVGEDFGGTVFVTDMFYQDLEPPTDMDINAVSISADGINGVEGAFDAFIPNAVLTNLGISSPDDLQGYVDGQGVSAESFEDLGQVAQGLFQYLNDANPVVYRYRVTNASWSKHDIQFGAVSEGTPSPSPSSSASPTPTATPTEPLTLTSDVTEQAPKQPVQFSGFLRNVTSPKRVLLKCTWKASKKVRLRTGKKRVARIYKTKTDASGSFSKTINMKAKPIICQARGKVNRKNKKSNKVKVTVLSNGS